MEPFVKKERDEVNYILSDIAFMGRQSGGLLYGLPHNK